MDINQDRIQALVGNSAETLNIELKNWVDPTTAEGQSKIVRAVLALRNRDGGELVDQTNLMALARPVDAHKPFNLFRHVQDLSRVTHVRAAATSVNPCTGARGATSHGTSVAADLPGCRSSPGAHNTGIRGRLPAGQPGPASLQCRPANNRFKGYRDSNPRSPGPRSVGAEHRFPGIQHCCDMTLRWRNRDSNCRSP